MSESERVQRWRQRQREAGKEPLTIWLTTAEKLHLEDMALSRHCSPSELVQQALAHLRGESLSVTATVTDTEQIRALVQQELARPHSVTVRNGYSYCYAATDPPCPGACAPSGTASRES